MASNGTFFAPKVAPNGTFFKAPHHADSSRKNRIVLALSLVKYSLVCGAINLDVRNLLAFTTILCHNKLKNVIKEIIVRLSSKRSAI